MTDKPAFNAGLPKPSKNQLRHGIYLWVKDRVEGHIGFSYLDSLSYDDMMLFARAMGYTGPGSDPVPEPVIRYLRKTIEERTTTTIDTPRGPVHVETGTEDPDEAMRREMEVTSEGGEKDGAPT